ncbi:unnamed protein product [Rotaria sordida]|uniref:Uncharacterized protein n=1 Tax=Rotaria sordida TaxID=392033 RepID=A0A818X0W7_9BILA|nr:unnamed protein product [Rotaria sordida]
MIRSNILIIIKSKEDIVNNELKNSQITTIEQNQRISRTLSRTDIQFKLKPFVLMFRRLLKYRVELNPAMQQ